MTYATLMVNLALGSSNRWLLELVTRTADKFGAGVIGLAAARPIQVVCLDYPVPAALFEEDRKQIAQQVKAAEFEFRSATGSLRNRVEWKAPTTHLPLAQHLASEARSADLIITEKVDAASDVTRRPDICDLVMKVGRPVLLVPAKASASAFNRVLMAWNDTREARRAIVDSLPFLAKAENVTVVEIAHDQELIEARNRVSEVVAWLARHGVRAELTVVPTSKVTAFQLDDIADQLGADLIVAGASGYSRQRKWVMGDVTSALLANSRCALLSH